MKKTILIWMAVIFYATNLLSQNKINLLKDGAYEVTAMGNDGTVFNKLLKGQMMVSFDTSINPGDYTKVVIDTTDYVPMELETMPTIELQNNQKKLLSITFTPETAEKMKSFTAKRLMKQVVIVSNGMAITTHKIRETIKGNNMQITGCSDHAYEQLLVIMKKNVKK